MDINFRIIWFEDIDEWYNTLSRRITRYIEKKNFNVKIERIKGVNGFNLDDFQMKDYDLLIVDYELEREYVDGEEKPSYGYEIIKTIRSGDFFNDVLFYSSHGFQTISDVMKNEGLQGVFIADRDNDEFMNYAKALVDKAVRRVENLVNIRGIVMEVTSDFDNMIRETISALWGHLGNNEDKVSKKIVKEILNENKSKAQKLLDKYPNIDSKNIDNLLAERDFTAFHQAKLLGWCINANDDLKEKSMEIFSKYVELKNKKKIPFFDLYKNDVIDYRNALAHVKNVPDATGDFYIGEIRGEKIIFNEELCNNLRRTLIQYNSLFKDLYSMIEEKL